MCPVVSLTSSRRRPLAPRPLPKSLCMCMSPCWVGVPDSPIQTPSPLFPSAPCSPGRHCPSPSEGSSPVWSLTRGAALSPPVSPTHSNTAVWGAACCSRSPPSLRCLSLWTARHVPSRQLRPSSPCPARGGAGGDGGGREAGAGLLSAGFMHCSTATPVVPALLLRPSVLTPLR